jgi:hypothetical protein
LSKTKVDSYTLGVPIIPLLPLSLWICQLPTPHQKGFRDEITFIAPGGTEAVGISIWDSREQADAYNNNGSYGEVLKELNKLVEGTPQVKAYDVANSTPHNIAARPAA